MWRKWRDISPLLSKFITTSINSIVSIFYLALMTKNYLYTFWTCRVPCWHNKCTFKICINLNSSWKVEKSLLNTGIDVSIDVSTMLYKLNTGIGVSIVLYEINTGIGVSMVLYEMNSSIDVSVVLYEMNTGIDVSIVLMLVLISLLYSMNWILV